MSAPVIQARNLTKRYGRVTAVDRLNLSVESGEVFGLLGPNGSGKTTTILMLMGLTDVTEGEIEVLGLDPARQPLAVKRRIGYMPDSVGFYDELSGRQNLRYTGRLAGLSGKHLDERIARELERVGMSEVADKPAGTYSRGMRQRLGLADALLKEPGLVILDEPTNGLDPHATREFLALIGALKRDGITVLLSSHLLDRVQAVCDRIALFHRGRIALLGTVTELAREVLGSGHRILVEAEGEGLEERLRRIPGVRAVQSDGPGHFVVDAESDLRGAVTEAVGAADGGRLLGLGLRQPSLDE
ncbi:MAG TPA: ABC transporter ATP-binding protein, partial [Kiloniellales bacterium]|nr:ABC transporter ATP-binding protein [Kiloniellales bacterium]